MEKHISPDSALAFNAINTLHLELNVQAENAETSELAQQLKDILMSVRGPRTAEKAVSRVLALINTIPDNPANRRLRLLLSSEGFQVKFRITTGQSLPKRPGTLLTCPRPDCLYFQFRMAKGEEIICPEHLVALVRPFAKRVSGK